MDTKFDALDQKVESFNTKNEANISSLKTEMEAKFSSLDQKIETAKN